MPEKFQEPRWQPVNKEALFLWADTLDVYFEGAEENVRELGQFLEAVRRRRDGETIGMAEVKAHAMKGASRTAGFDMVAGIAEELENHFRRAGDNPRVLDVPWVEHRLLELEKRLGEARELAAQLLGRGT